MDNAAIEIHHLYKTFKGALVPALDGLTLSVSKGTCVGLLGPNGAGKTTCISILCGMAEPDKGKAAVLGKDCIKDTMAIRRAIGVVPQEIALFSNLTANENFRYIGRMYGLAEKTISQKSKMFLERFGLDKHADKRISQYSGGMQRRANLIAALLHEPQLLILDEPTVGVDVQSRALILEFISEFRQQGNTLLYTSHLMEEAQKICDEVVIIDEGKHMVSGTPEKLVAAIPGCQDLEDVFLHYTGHSVRN